jgi:hypothetical protein
MLLPNAELAAEQAEQKIDASCHEHHLGIG